jgi:hypothetical protein
MQNINVYLMTEGAGLVELKRAKSSGTRAWLEVGWKLRT